MSFNKIHIDYELGIFSALKKCFPNIILKGCNFHHSKAHSINLNSSLKESFYSDHQVNFHFYNKKNICVIYILMILKQYLTKLLNLKTTLRRNLNNFTNTTGKLKLKNMILNYTVFIEMTF
jgi:hypothetical protein